MLHPAVIPGGHRALLALYCRTRVAGWLVTAGVAVLTWPALVKTVLPWFNPRPWPTALIATLIALQLLAWLVLFSGVWGLLRVWAGRATRRRFLARQARRGRTPARRDTARQLLQAHDRRFSAFRHDLD